MHILFMPSLSSFFLCFLIILVSYSSIAIKIFFGKQPHCHCAKNRERKLTKTLFIVTVVSSLLTVPLIIFRIYYEVPLRTYILQEPFWFEKSFGYIQFFRFFFYFMHSLINPNIRNSGFKRALFSFLHCISETQPAQPFSLNEK